MADRPLPPLALAPGTAEGLDRVWVMHAIAELLVKEDATANNPSLPVCLVICGVATVSWVLLRNNRKFTILIKRYSAICSWVVDHF